MAGRQTKRVLGHRSAICGDGMIAAMSLGMSMSAELRAELRGHLSEIGKIGGKNRGLAMSPGARSRQARRAAKARWIKTANSVPEASAIQFPSIPTASNDSTSA